MKLFGGIKRQKAVRGDNASASDETRILRVDKNRIRKASSSRSGKKKRTLKIVFCSILLVLVLAAVLCLAISLTNKTAEAENDHSVNGENLEPSDEKSSETDNSIVLLPLSPVETVEPFEQEAEEPAEQSNHEPGENVRNNNCYTFLIAAYNSEGISVDTIMVSRLDVEEATLNVVNIPRDTLVNVSWALKKINTVMAYEDRDARRFISEVSSITGIPIDYYAFIDASTVEKMIDAIGGVYYTVPINMDYDDPALDLHIHVPTGRQWLNGDKVVEVLRFKIGNNGSGYPNGDLGRLETLQDFLTELFTQFIESGEIPNLEDAAEIFEEYSTGNMDADKFIVFAEELLKLDAQNIRFATLPGKNVGISDISYYEISPVEWMELTNEYLNPYSQDIALHNLDILSYDSSAGTVMSSSGEIIDMDSFY